MDFGKRMGKANKNSIFEMEGYFVWCGTVTKGDDGLYYLYFSFWPKEKGAFNDQWVICSKVGWAVSDNPYGGFTYGGIALEGKPGSWDADSIHNPAVLKVDGKYYMYHMGNYGNGEYWNHRNHQRIGCAVADNPRGPFVHSDQPVVDVTPGSFDSLMTSNPSVTQGPDGKFYMIYKAVHDNGERPKGGAVICGLAVADKPDGPFEKYGKPLFVNPEHGWSVEDTFIWYENGKFYALAKDFQGYFTKTHRKGDTALFVSENGYDWAPDAEHPFACGREIEFEDGTKTVHRMERPQIYFEDGKPKVISWAVMPDISAEHTYNIILPIDKE